MGRIFRSDEPRVGERVVVRRVFKEPGSPATGGVPEPTFSDVIGHVISTDPLVLRPQEVGGYPSELDTIKIPAENIHIIKKLSPRMIRNSDIRAIETATASAFPGKEHTWTQDGQWLMRAGDGVTERSNSAVPLGASAGFSPVPLAEITQFYSRHNLPVQLLLPERLGRPAERLLQESPAGTWTLGPEILVMTRDLHTLPAATAPSLKSGAYEFRVEEQPSQQWLDLYHFRGQPLPAQALEFLRKTIDGTMGFGSLVNPDGQTVAVTRGTLTEDPAGSLWLGFSAVEVSAQYRRQGLGTTLGVHMLHWGKQNGASNAYLQVLGSNRAGISLYEKLGFIEHHRNRCASLPTAAKRVT